MAAGAYKGLTIRIAADTSKFSSALRGMNSVVFKTQAELNKLSQAARLDPRNQNLAQMQVGKLAEQATNAAHQMELLKSRIGELATTQLKNSDGKLVDDTSIAELAEGTKSVTLEAQRWSAAYNDVNGRLNTIYGQVRAITDDEVDLREITNDGEWNQGLIDSLRAAHPELSSILDEVESMKEEWGEARYNMENFKKAAEMSRLVSDLALMEAKAKDIGRQFAEMSGRSNVSKGLQSTKEKLDLIVKGGETASDRFRRLNDAMSVKPTSLGTAIDRIKAFREATDAAHMKAKNLREQLAAYDAAGVGKMADGVRDAALEFEKAKDKVARLKTELELAEAQEGETSDRAQELGRQLQTALRELDSAAAVNEYRELQVQLREVKAESASLKQAMRADLGEVGAAAVNAAEQVGQYMQQIGSKVVQASEEIDASYRDLRKTFDGTEAQYEAIYDASMRYSQSNVTGADKMLEMASIAAQLGVGLDDTGNVASNAAEQINKFTEVAANLDVATNIDSETIALQMGQISNVMSDLSPDNIQSFGDALVRLGNTMPTQESNIMQITQRLSAIGDVAHFTTPQLMGWAAAIASTGQKSEAAASGIATTVTKISAAASEGEEAVQGFADVAGMSAEQFIEQWRSDPSETLRKFVEGLKDAGDDVFATLMGLEIKGVRQNQTLASLAQTVDTVSSAISRAEEAWDGGGDAAAEAEKKASGFSGTLQILRNDAKILAAEFGDAMVPFMKQASEWMQRLIEWLDGLDDSTKTTAVVVGGLFAAISVAAPIIEALGGNLLRLASGGLRLATNGLATLVTGVKGTVSILGSFAKAPVEVSSALSGLGGSVGLFGKALGLIASPLGVVVAGIGALAAVVGGYYITEFVKAKVHGDQFRDSIDGINSATADLGREMYLGSDAVEQYAEKWSAARVNMDEYLSKLQEHNQRNADTRTEMGETIGLLSRYQDIIGEAAGKGDEYAGSVGELQWALDGLNEITGESWTVQDVLRGKYEDETGAVRNTKDAIDELIEARKKEARANAVSEMLTENYKAQMENEQAYKEATSAYHDYVDAMLEAKSKMGEDSFLGSMSDSEYIGWLKENDDHMKGLLQDRKELREVDLELQGQEQDLAATLGTLTSEAEYAKAENYGFRESVMMLNDSMRGALENAGIMGEDVKRLSQGIADAGVTAEDLASITDEQFSKMVEDSGGHVNTLIGLIAQYNAEQFEEKYVGIEFDQNGLAYLDGVRVEWNGTDWKPVNVEVEGADEASAKVEEVKQKAEEPAKTTVEGDTAEAERAVDQFVEETNATEATVTVKADTSQTEGTETTSTVTTNVDVKGADKIAKLGKQIEGLPKNTPVKITVSAEKKKVTDVNAALTKVARTWNAKLNVTVSGSGAVNAILQTLRDANGKRYNTYYDIHRTTHEKTVKNARGGYLPLSRIPKHADGFIATRPTLTDYGWIGEDGAEAYSGGSLVPLTNRKYSQPYVDEISDAVARKLGPANSAPQVTVTVTGVSGPDEVADAIARKLALLGL